MLVYVVMVLVNCFFSIFQILIHKNLISNKQLINSNKNKIKTPTVFPLLNAVAFIKFHKFRVRRILEGGFY